MIIRTGIDICQVSRLEAALRRRPGLASRLFDPAELVSASGAPRPVRSLAGRFAAKEALAKAVGTGGSWLDARVLSGADGSPHLQLKGPLAQRAAELGITAIHLSISHDGGLAVAMVICEGGGGRDA